MQDSSRSTRFSINLGRAALTTVLLLPATLHAQWTPGPNVTLVNPTDKVGIGTAAPVSPLHVHQNISTSLGAAQTITFSDAIDSIAGIGLNVNATPLQDKGTQIGVWSTSTVNGPAQSGTVQGRLGQASSFFAAGDYTGVLGLSAPTVLSTFPAPSPGKTSFGTGGRFTMSPTGTLSLTNGTNGRIWVGGVYAEVTGTINGSPGPGAVAAVIGVDSAAGTAPHWAGYFKGRSYFSSTLSIGLPLGFPATQMVDVQGTARLRNMPNGHGRIVVALPDGTLALSPKVAAKDGGDDVAALLTRNAELERRLTDLEAQVRSLAAARGNAGPVQK
jgi:hypothetical protein